MVSFMNRKSLYLFTRKRKEKNGKRGDNSWKEKILDMIDWLLFNFHKAYHISKINQFQTQQHMVVTEYKIVFPTNHVLW
jgi:hypothetical protein